MCQEASCRGAVQREAYFAMHRTDLFTSEAKMCCTGPTATAATARASVQRPEQSDATRKGDPSMHAPCRTWSSECGARAGGSSQADSATLALLGATSREAAAAGRFIMKTRERWGSRPGKTLGPKKLRNITCGCNVIEHCDWKPPGRCVQSRHVRICVVIQCLFFRRPPANVLNQACVQ